TPRPLATRTRMDRVPRRSFCRNKVSPFVERGHFIAPLIVRHGTAITKDATHTLKMILPIDHDLRMPDRISKFIQHLAAKHGVRRQPQSQAFRIEIGTSDDRGRVPVMLVVGSRNKSALRPLERVLACRNTKLEASIIASNDRLQALPILNVPNRD